MMAKAVFEAIKEGLTEALDFVTDKDGTRHPDVIIHRLRDDGTVERLTAIEFRSSDKSGQPD